VCFAVPFQKEQHLCVFAVLFQKEQQLSVCALPFQMNNICVFLLSLFRNNSIDGSFAVPFKEMAP